MKLALWLVVAVALGCCCGWAGVAQGQCPLDGHMPPMEPSKYKMAKGFSGVVFLPENHPYAYKFSPQEKEFFYSKECMDVLRKPDLPPQGSTLPNKRQLAHFSSNLLHFHETMQLDSISRQCPDIWKVMSEGLDSDRERDAWKDRKVYWLKMDKADSDIKTLAGIPLNSMKHRTWELAQTVTWNIIFNKYAVQRVKGWPQFAHNDQHPGNYFAKKTDKQQICYHLSGAHECCQNTLEKDGQRYQPLLADFDMAWKEPDYNFRRCDQDLCFLSALSIIAVREARNTFMLPAWYLPGATFHDWASNYTKLGSSGQAPNPVWDFDPKGPQTAGLERMLMELMQMDIESPLESEYPTPPRLRMCNPRLPPAQDNLILDVGFYHLEDPSLSANVPSFVA